jgi:hypothetical protein
MPLFNKILYFTYRNSIKREEILKNIFEIFYRQDMPLEQNIRVCKKVFEIGNLKYCTLLYPGALYAYFRMA